MLCQKCGGRGSYLGNGMILVDCDCDDIPINKATISKSNIPINRKTKSYQNAIKEIMEINPDITREEAVKIFDKAYEKE